jgi:membrane protein
MAALRDVPIVLRRMGARRFCKNVYREIGDDNLYTWASALAYSWLFAIFPFLIVLLTLIPVLKFEWRKEAQTQIENAIKQLPHDAQAPVWEYVDPKLTALLYERPVGISGIWSVGLLLTLWASSGGMAMTMAAMDRAYDVERMRPFYKQRPLAVLLTLVVATLILAVVVLIPVGTLVTHYLTSGTEEILVATKLQHGPTTVMSENGHVHHTFRVWIVLWHIVRHSLAVVLLLWVVALVYHFGPNVKQKFRVITPGAVFTIAVWLLLGFLFRVYVDRFGSAKYSQTYGAIGGVIILLFFFYIDALVLLVGAEINSEIDAAIRTWHHEQGKPPPAETLTDSKPALETP